jgi:hypothetical protein
MLFDLRGRGRRTAVKIIYVGLALLIGVGLVGFGIGGGFGSGGLFSAASSNEGAGGASFAKQVAKYETLTKKQPSNASAWANLTKALLHESGNEAYVTAAGTVTAKGKQLYKRVSSSWKSYLALNPSKPNVELAQLVYVVYTEGGLNEAGKAVEALQLIVAERPESAHYYSLLAIYAYKAHNERIGDLASEKAIQFAPSSERTRLKTELAQYKKYPNGNTEQTYTTTTNGKTYAVKKAANGQFTGTQIETTPKPKTTSTSKK